MNTLPHKFEWSIEQNVLCIVDLDQGGPSVTNAAEAVLELISLEIGETRFHALAAIIYRDSLGSWDGIKPLPNSSVSFYHLNSTDKLSAIAKALELLHAHA